MTPNPVSPVVQSSMGRGVAIGAAASVAVFFVLGVLGAIVGYSAVKKAEADARRGWNLVPVVVAAKDISESSVVTFDMISQRSIPEQFVTSSVIKPDSASYVVNQKILVPAGKENCRDPGQTERGADRTYQQQSLAAEPVDHRHCNYGEQQVGGSDGNRLQVA